MSGSFSLKSPVGMALVGGAVGYLVGPAVLPAYSPMMLGAAGAVIGYVAAKQGYD
jgi:hypothetical protein